MGRYTILFWVLIVAVLSVAVLSVGVGFVWHEVNSKSSASNAGPCFAGAGEICEWPLPACVAGPNELCPPPAMRDLSEDAADAQRAKRALRGYKELQEREDLDNFHAMQMFQQFAANNPGYQWDAKNARFVKPEPLPAQPAVPTKK